MDLVYLMHATTAPLDPRARAAMVPLLEEDPRHPDGLLATGRRAREIIEQARGEVARMCGGMAAEIVFTSSGTEACNLAMKGVPFASAARGRPGGRILVAATEHSAVLYPARTLAKLGFEIVEVPVDGEGVVDLDALESALRRDALLVSIALATAETGTLQPLERIADLAHARGALVHTDACLAASARRIDVGGLQVDLMSLSSHKVSGPRGTGALWAREGVRLLPLIEGGVSEAGRRGGAENVAGIAGFGVVAGLLAEEVASEGERRGRLAARLQRSLMEVPGVHLNGPVTDRLPGMLNLSVEGIDGEALVLKLATRGIAVSTGSSCFQETGKPSHVLLAMGAPPARARGSVLFSLGRGTTEADLDQVAAVFPEAVASLRSISVDR